MSFEPEPLNLDRVPMLPPWRLSRRLLGYARPYLPHLGVSLLLLLAMSLTSWVLIAIKGLSQTIRARRSEQFLRLFWNARSLEEVNAEIATHGHVLTPGRYVGAEEVEDDGEPFEKKMPRLVAELNAQFAESAKLEQAIKANLRGLGYGG